MRRSVPIAGVLLLTCLGVAARGASPSLGVASVSDHGISQVIASDMIVDDEPVGVPQSVSKKITSSVQVSDLAGNLTSDSAIAAPTSSPLASSGSTCCNSCNSVCGECCDDCCSPRFSVRAGAVIMQRIRPQSSLLAVNATTGDTLANADDFLFNAAGGPDLSVFYHFDSDRSLEARYFGIDGWNVNQSFTTPNIWAIPSAVPILAPPGSATINYSSRLYSTEINLRNVSGFNERWTWLFGFRWVQMDDDLRYNIDAGASDATVNYFTGNNLYGAQLGGDVRLWDRGGPFTADVVVKGGVYGNSARQATSIFSGPAFTAESSENRGKVAFVGEIGVTGAYQWTDHIAIRGGYQMMWLQGVAVASDQVAVANIATGDGLETSGNVFYHGALMSLDFTW